MRTAVFIVILGISMIFLSGCEAEHEDQRPQAPANTDLSTPDTGDEDPISETQPSPGKTTGDSEGGDQEDGDPQPVDPLPTPDPEPELAIPDFASLRAVFRQQGCFNCHGSFAFALDNYSGLLQSQKKIVIPEDSENSLLIRSLRQEAGARAMPPGRPIDSDIINNIAAWIDAGAPQ